jgi:hypothetical protein
MRVCDTCQHGELGEEVEFDCLRESVEADGVAGGADDNLVVAVLVGGMDGLAQC